MQISERVLRSTLPWSFRQYQDFYYRVIDDNFEREHTFVLLQTSSIKKLKRKQKLIIEAYIIFLNMFETNESQKVLYIPTNLGDDQVSKPYSIDEKSIDNLGDFKRRHVVNPKDRTSDELYREFTDYLAKKQHDREWLDVVLQSIGINRCFSVESEEISVRHVKILISLEQRLLFTRIFHYITRRKNNIDLRTYLDTLYECDRIISENNCYLLQMMYHTHKDLVQTFDSIMVQSIMERNMDYELTNMNAKVQCKINKKISVIQKMNVQILRRALFIHMIMLYQYEYCS
jgi:hypothetical protein